LSVISRLVTLFASTHPNSYRMQLVGANKNTARTSIPRSILERHANHHNLTVEEFVNQYEVRWHTRIDTIHMSFVKR